MNDEWYNDVNSVSLEDAANILTDPLAKKLFPNQYQKLKERIEKYVDEETVNAKREDPLPWVTLSVEQTLKLNAWWAGYTNIIDFDANRIGKTAGQVMNAIMWMIPMDPSSPLFQEKLYNNKRYRLLPRPSIENVLKIQDHFKENKQYATNPLLSFDHPENREAFESIPRELLAPAFPKPSICPPEDQTIENSLWQGAPDNKFHDEVTLKEWQKWLPKRFIKKVSTHEYTISLHLPKTEHHQSIDWIISFKSYDSPDTKWSGAAVDGIFLTECPPLSIFSEIRQRFKETGVGGWDYTPYEARNTSRNSKLAYNIFIGKEEAPLRAAVFSGSGIESAPSYILPDRKRADLIRQWEGKPEGEARIHGKFYSSVPLALPNLKEEIHCLPTLSFRQLKKIRPRLRLFRGLDPGWDHVTACVWVAQSPLNEFFIYRGYSEAGRTISERVEDIVSLSNNVLIPHPKTKEMFIEQQTNTNSETYQATFIDYHAFKTDENTGLPFARNYIKAGLQVIPSITLGPRERALKFDDRLRVSVNLSHPVEPHLPGSKVYFLTSEPGVANIWDKLDNLFWLTFEQGSKKGESKKTLQDFNDDEFDAAAYIICSPFADQFIVQQKESESRIQMQGSQNLDHLTKRYANSSR